MPRPARPHPTALFRLYRVVAACLAPFAFRKVSAKLEAHGVPLVRQRERLGLASVHRPDGPILWFHGASVGESVSVLSLIAEMGRRLPDWSFLITSGTATSAEIVGKRLPPRTLHQFAPLDAPGPVKCFLDQWHPEAAVFVESELWPVTLMEARARGLRLGLLNARLSEKSRAGWLKRPKTARMLMDVFDILIAQNAEMAGHLRDMGADPARIRTGANLKSVAAPLPVDDDTLNALRTALDGRPVWAASSTHPGEEEIVLATHATLRARWPDLCLVLIPRHPERGDAVEALVRGAGLSVARRSKGEVPGPETAVYLADTLGETGTWYALCPIVYMGGGLVPVGGHNPFEPARAGAAVLTGPQVFNFTETFAPLLACDGALEVADGAALTAALARWLDDPAALAKSREAARGFAAATEGALDAVIDPLVEALALDSRQGQGRLGALPPPALSAASPEDI
ncbi:3-deoxy-D-manno-octulosonic acid transferase [Chachezhania sediminis]|uniref:3-deoxy-D-manno-octulosonic acid transferase n=1 Tax=Chachezhania sediminis TaxID=2599291 RepID=UPI00131EBB5F|nr:3-deoxy-D-manno-octulosonic acid transferase [Chachezhania sediminis]